MDSLRAMLSAVSLDILPLNPELKIVIISYEIQIRIGFNQFPAIKAFRNCLIQPADALLDLSFSWVDTSDIIVGFSTVRFNRTDTPEQIEFLLIFSLYLQNIGNFVWIEFSKSGLQGSGLSQTAKMYFR